MTTRLPRSTSRALPVLFLGFMLCIYHSSQAQQLIPGNISISPSEPTKSWNPARDLYPDESITLDVHVESTGTSGGKEWDLDPGSTKIILDRANSLWTSTQGEDGDTDFTFEILSLGRVPSRHDVKVTATWKTPRQGGGGGGGGSETKPGSAEGWAYTNIPVFTWYFHSRLTFADGQNTNDFEAVADANGASISLNNYTIHGEQGWNIVNQVNPADTITGSVDSDVPGKGKLKVFFDGNDIDESEDEIGFIKAELVEVLEQDETAGCTGYDEDENALMVPMEGSNKIKVIIVGAPHDLLNEIKFVSNPPEKLTINPQAPASEQQELTLSGTSAAGGVKVQIEINGIKEDLFEADVLNKKVVSLNVRTIVDMDTNIVVSSPTQNDITEFLKIFRHQANVFFEDVSVSNVIIDYDQTDNQAFNYIPHGPFNFTEIPLLLAGAPRTPAIDCYIFKSIDPDDAQGAYLREDDFIIMKDTASKCTPLYIMAHEVGHALGRSGHSSNEKALMADGESSTCGRKIGRDDWLLMND